MTGGGWGRLPPYRVGRLPPFPGWAAALGPGIVWMALAQGSSELIWWPYLIAKYGLAFLCLLVPACLLQFPINYAIGSRVIYTLIERVMTVVAVVTLVGLLAACSHPDVRAAAPAFLRGLVIPSAPSRPWDSADATKLLTAITFAGLGGFWTLFYSSASRGRSSCSPRSSASWEPSPTLHSSTRSTIGGCPAISVRRSHRSAGPPSVLRWPAWPTPRWR